MKPPVIVSLLLAVLVQTNGYAGETMTNELTIGKAAPGFTLVDQAGKPHRLADYRGRWLVLYFYPKDDTPGCTKEACTFRDDQVKYDQVNAAVVGISIDNSDSHAAFAKKYHLPFPLLADSGGKVASAYGSFFSFGPLKYSRRHTFIIDPDGRLAKIYRDVKPASHSNQVLADLRSLQNR